MQEPDEILHDNAETYRSKEDDYGKSWTLGGEVLHLLAGGENVVLETPEDFIAFGLFTRRLDKFIRAFNLEFLHDEEPEFESVVDSHSDESTYAAMHASLLAGLGTTEYVNDGGTETEAQPPEEYMEYVGDAVLPEVMGIDSAAVDPAYEAEYQRRVGGSE